MVQRCKLKLLERDSLQIRDLVVLKASSGCIHSLQVLLAREQNELLKFILKPLPCE